MAKKSKSRFTAEVEDDYDDDPVEEKTKEPEPKPAKKTVLPPNYDLAINVPPKPEED